jgi:hypothetical protein
MICGGACKSGITDRPNNVPTQLFNFAFNFDTDLIMTWDFDSTDFPSEDFAILRLISLLQIKSHSLVITLIE